MSMFRRAWNLGGGVGRSFFQGPILCAATEAARSRSSIGLSKESFGLSPYNSSPAKVVVPGMVVRIPCKQIQPSIHSNLHHHALGYVWLCHEAASRPAHEESAKPANSDGFEVGHSEGRSQDPRLPQADP